MNVRGQEAPKSTVRMVGTGGSCWPTGTHFLNLRLLGDVLSGGHLGDESCARPRVPRGHLPVPCFPQKGESAGTALNQGRLGL